LNNKSEEIGRKLSTSTIAAYLEVVTEIAKILIHYTLPPQRDLIPRPPEHGGGTVVKVLCCKLEGGSIPDGVIGIFH
jgi:hypothetical protein